jgi:N-acetylmuramoyl-L-alanine amidase
VVIVDPGHGGQDPGTMNHGLWEHDYVYDVACRLKRRLERDTLAKVRMTLVDEGTGTGPSSTDDLEANKQGTLQTHPPFVAQDDGDTSVGVNLRWYLANSIYRAATKQGVHPDRVVFLSLHADSRHPSLRGAMVYVPGSDYRRGTYGFRSERYLRFKEVREKPTVSFSARERLRSEAVSRSLASSIVRELKRDDLPVQEPKPVRGRVIRGGATWLPAVLKGNAVPTKVLVEMLNLSNEEDARLLGRAADRERIASALADSLVGYFGQEPARSGAASSR